MIQNRRVPVLMLGAALLIVAVVAVLVIAWPRHCQPTCPSGNSSTAASDVNHPTGAPPVLTVTPGADATEVDPLAPVSVTATSGRLIEVAMLNEHGNRIVGVMTPDNAVWKPGVPLGYGRAYTMTITAAGTDGTVTRQVSRFSTLRPSNQTLVSLTTTAGAALQDGATYGIGTVIVAHFDEPITDRAVAERRLSVTTQPPVLGSWYWVMTKTPTGDLGSTSPRAPRSPPQPTSMALTWAMASTARKTLGWPSPSVMPTSRSPTT